MKQNKVSSGLMVMALILFFSISSTSAAVFNVANSTEFQSALTIAATNSENDTIQVAAGTYNLLSSLAFSSSENFSLAISGAGKNSTYLNGGNAVQILTVTTTQVGADIKIQDLAFQNGTTIESGGALSVTTVSGTITIDDCEVADSDATSGDSVGGGASLATDTGMITVSSCEFLRNGSSGNVGGLYAATVTGSLQLVNCTFEQNSVTNSGGSDYFGDGGGAMFYSDSTSQASIQGNFFTNNTAGGGSNPDGGGLMTYQLGANSALTLENNSFSNNTAGLGGGGCILRFNDSGTATITNNIFSENQTNIGSGAGAMVYIDTGTLTYSGNIHTRNQSAEDGGGAWINLFSGNGTISNNVFTGNQVTSNGGGLSLVTESATTTVMQNVFSGNQAGNVGGGVSYATTTGTLNAYNNTFYNNTGSGDGGGVYLYCDQTEAVSTLKNNILWHDTPNEFGYSYGAGTAIITMTYSDVENGTGESWFGTGCISLDPLFVRPAEDEFALKWQNYPVSDASKSPCIDSGDPSSTPDADGTRSDMGAFTYVQSQPLVTISDVALTYTSPLQAGDSVAVTVDAVATDSSQLYYKFYYRGNYGTSAYDSSPWTVVQTYSTNNQAVYNFNQEGSYVIVVRVVTNPANEPASLPIIGGVVIVGGDTHVVDYSGFSSDIAGTLEAGTSVTFSVDAETVADDTLYYKFYYRGNYGSAAYNSSPWVVARAYAANHQATFSFPESGSYVVVVRAVTDPANEPSVLPIIGATYVVE